MACTPLVQTILKRSSASWEPSQKRNGIHLPAMAPDFKMEVGPACIPRMPTESDDLTPINLFTFPDQDGREVTVNGDCLSPVVQPDHISVSAHGARKPNPSPGHGPYLRPIRNADIDSPMEIWLEALEAYTERGGEAAYYRPVGKGTPSDQ